MEDNFDDDLTIHGSQITNNPIPFTPNIINRDDLKTDDTRDMSYIDNKIRDNLKTDDTRDMFYTDNI